MRQHWKHKIVWEGFPDTHRKVPDAYMINDFYIGASKHIRGRVIQHINDSFIWAGTSKRKVVNLVKEAYSKNGFITVKRLSDNPFDEAKFIKKYSPVGNSGMGKAYHEQYNKQP